MRIPEQAGLRVCLSPTRHDPRHPGGGRLIRSETDRGVIALLCQRFLQEPYVSRLPRDWYDEWPAQLISQHPAEEDS